MVATGLRLAFCRGAPRAAVPQPGQPYTPPLPAFPAPYGTRGLQTPHTPSPSPAGTCLEPGALPPQASPVALPAVARHRRLRRGRHGRGRAGGGSASLSQPRGCLWGAGGLGSRSSVGPQLAAGPWASGAGWRKRPERGWQWGGDGERWGGDKKSYSGTPDGSLLAGFVSEISLRSCWPPEPS